MAIIEYYSEVKEQTESFYDYLYNTQIEKYSLIIYHIEYLLLFDAENS